MFFSRLKIYTVFLKPDEQDEIERLRFVSEGFNFYAFVFTLFWAFYQRMWRFAGIILLIYALLWLAASHIEAFGAVTTRICHLGVQLWVGFAAHEFMSAHLKRKGFITYALVSGENELRAEQRFFDQNAARLAS